MLFLRRFFGCKIHLFCRATLFLSANFCRGESHFVSRSYQQHFRWSVFLSVLSPAHSRSSLAYQLQVLVPRNTTPKPIKNHCSWGSTLQKPTGKTHTKMASAISSLIKWATLSCHPVRDWCRVILNLVKRIGNFNHQKQERGARADHVVILLMATRNPIPSPPGMDGAKTFSE